MGHPICLHVYLPGHACICVCTVLYCTLLAFCQQSISSGEETTLDVSLAECIEIVAKKQNAARNKQM